VFVECAGAGEICSALRTALVQALEREGATVTRRAGAADVVIQAAANAGDTTTDQQFGTAFTVTSFTMELSAEAPTAGNAEVSMPAPRTFSFDSRFGRDRLAENARALAGDAADRVMRFWKKHAGG
jgi:rRNA maturation protein Nop10